MRKPDRITDSASITIDKWDSLDFYIDWCEFYFKQKFEQYTPHNTRYEFEKWLWDERHNLLQKAKNGRLDLIPEAKRRAYKTASLIRQPSREFLPSISGSRVDIASYCRGEPLHMRRKQTTTRQSPGYRIIFCSDCSANDDYHGRGLFNVGMDLAGLILGLRTFAAVELYIYYLNGIESRANTYFHLIRIPVHPLNLAQLCHVVTSAAFTAEISFAAVRTKATGPTYVTWPSTWDKNNSQVRALNNPLWPAVCRKMLPHVFTWNTLLMEPITDYGNFDLLDWFQREINRIRGGTEADLENGDIEANSISLF